MNVEKARFNMIEQQIRTWEVLDRRVLDCIARTPREEYVPREYRDLAFSDTAIPLGDGELMMPPRVEARVLQSLRLTPGDRVLEVGTGSGYLAALLAALARQVISVEISPRLAAFAQANLAAHSVDNVTVAAGDAARGWRDGAPYDAIAVTGSMPVLTGELQRQLKPGGRLFAVVGDAPVMEARLISRVTEDGFHTESLFETLLPPLRGVQRPARFVV
jgi:protein-L-isoaspartate(D-aspartate) O-methyltransferase